MPDVVLRAYNTDSLSFGRTYILPKPLDPRALTWIAPAVAQAAIESGVAQRMIDLDNYRAELASRIKSSVNLDG